MKKRIAKPGILDFLRTGLIRKKYLLETFLSSKKIVAPGKEYKCLYVSPVGRSGKAFLKKIIMAFGTVNFDYLIFSYDGTVFDEPVFSTCKVVQKKGLRWEFMKQYVTPEYCREYDFIFAWADDIDIEGFSIDNYLNIVIRNGLQLSQPALTKTSYYSHEITLKKDGAQVGRFTDFVEIMIPVFERTAWNNFWNNVMNDTNGWGWGYDIFAKSKCGYKRVGIIDCESVCHTRKQRPANEKTSHEFEKYVKSSLPDFRKSLMLSYGMLR